MTKFNWKKRTVSGTVNKAVIWHPAAKNEISSYPDEVRIKIGFHLYSLQVGENLHMPVSRPMSSVESGVFELRAKSEDEIYRVFYILKLSDGIYVLHAFKKKTEKTPIDEIRLAKKRLKELLEN